MLSTILLENYLHSGISRGFRFSSPEKKSSATKAKVRGQELKLLEGWLAKIREKCHSKIKHITITTSANHFVTLHIFGFSVPPHVLTF